jgi:uncharacterized BrkB/YihY/UPF0761 family membrane protein
MSKKTILNGIIFILVIIVTFQGLGPVIFADGTMLERTYTFLVVAAIYVLLFLAFYYVNKRSKSRH